MVEKAILRIAFKNGVTRCYNGVNRAWAQDTCKYFALNRDRNTIIKFWADMFNPGEGRSLQEIPVSAISSVSL
jgi:hypothetical protein